MLPSFLITIRDSWGFCFETVQDRLKVVGNGTGFLYFMACAPRYDLLLIAADLEERRLLFAELLEAGYTVLPLSSLIYAIRLMRAGTIATSLILLVAYGDDGTIAARVEDLLRLASGSRLILVVGSIESERWETWRNRVAALLYRPISVGEIVDVVHAVLPLSKPIDAEL